jgi:hypothetical protein
MQKKLQSFWISAGMSSGCRETWRATAHPENPLRTPQRRSKRAAFAMKVNRLPAYSSTSPIVTDSFELLTSQPEQGSDTHHVLKRREEASSNEEA